MSACEQEMCRYWTGDGCACAVLGIDRDERQSDEPITDDRHSDGKHECPYKSCDRAVSQQYFACRAHWMKVPATLRAALYAAVNGPVDEYLAVRAECVEEMNKR